MRSRDGGRDASPTEEARSGRPSSHVPIRAERPTTDSYALPLGWDETVGPRDRARNRPLRQRPLNRETLSNRPALLTVPQRAADHPEQPVERGKQDDEAGPEEGDARIDDEPLRHEADRVGAAMTTTREPVLGAHAARVVERARERDAVTETHFKSDLSSWVGRYVAGLYRTVLYDVNVVLFQYAPNFLSILRIHASNADAALDLAVTVLNDLNLERDAIQTKNDFSTQ